METEGEIPCLATEIIRREREMKTMMRGTESTDGQEL